MEFKGGIIERLLFDTKFWIVRHSLFWIFMYLPEVFGMFGIVEGYFYDIYFFSEVFFDIVLVYFHLYFLVPKFLLKSRFSTFLLISFLSLLAVAIINYFIYDNLCDDCNTLESIISILLTTGTLLATAIAFKLFKLAFDEKSKAEELKAINMQYNLKTLQDQVNPHFLFNSLNSIYVQAKQKSPKVPEAILQLSELMRYQTYDSQKDFVKLTKEIEYLKNYLFLEKQRRDQLKIGFIVNGETSGSMVSPLIFLPLVENAVKYSQRSDDQLASINVKLEVSSENVNFQIVNTLSDFDVNKGKDHGSGLANLRKRLDIIYPDHSLETSLQEDQFFAELDLPRK